MEAINSMEIGERAIFRLSGGAVDGSTGDAKDANANGPKYVYVKYIGHVDNSQYFCEGCCAIQLGKKYMKVNGKDSIKSHESIKCCNKELHCSGYDHFAKF